MKKAAMLLAAAGLILATGRVAVATIVVESITGSPGDWTYTYTLTNQESLPIYHWAVWFPSNPNADSVTAGTANWDATNLSTQGFFPEEYVDFWGEPVKDSAGNDLVGPNGEPGFYSTYASDYTSGNSAQYWDGDSWEPLPDPLPDFSDPIWDARWRGEDYGWTGSGANIQTGYGIPSGGTGQFSVHSTALVTGWKSYSYSTTDYWYAGSEVVGGQYVVYCDFEGSGMIPEPSGLIVWSLLGALGITVGWWRHRLKAA